MNLVSGVCDWLSLGYCLIGGGMYEFHSVRAGFHGYQLTDGLGEGFLIFYWVGFMGFNSSLFG